MILLLLGAARDVISRGEATAEDISKWLEAAEWDRIIHLASDPWPGLPSVEKLASEIRADLLSICDQAELMTIRIIARFKGLCDEASAARLTAAVSASALSADPVRSRVHAELGLPAPTALAPVSQVLGKLAAAGLAKYLASSGRPTWYLHPLLKLVASRLPSTADIGDEGLQEAFVDTVSWACADLVAGFRSDTAGVIDMLGRYKQNIMDANLVALKHRQLLAASHLTEGLCLYCRFTGDVDLLSGVLDRSLPYFIDTGTGALRAECSEVGLRVWDQAILLSAYWPRNEPMRHGRVRLIPPENDDYARGLWLREIGQAEPAEAAFRAELDTPSRSPRYASGDIECYLVESLVQQERWPDALRESLQSYAARLPDDSLGRASSRIWEARIRMAMIFNREDRQVSGGDVRRVEVTPEDLAAMDEIAAILREAQDEAGGQSAENRSQAAMLWSQIMLMRGDLTSAISSFEEGTVIMMALEKTAIWSHYWWFALNLVHHGWIARGYEYAANAFLYAMRAGSRLEMHETCTMIRQFCEQLEAAFPELTGRNFSHVSGSPNS